MPNVVKSLNEVLIYLRNGIQSTSFYESALAPAQRCSRFFSPARNDEPEEVQQETFPFLNRRGCYSCFSEVTPQDCFLAEPHPLVNFLHCIHLQEAIPPTSASYQDL